MIQFKKGLILITISALTFGLMPGAVTFCFEQGANTTIIVLFRYLVIILLLLPVMLRTKQFWMYFKLNWKKTLCLSTMSSVTPILLFHSYQYLPTSLATTIHFMYPTIVMLLCLVFFHDRFSKSKLLCLLLCFVGIITLNASHQKVIGLGFLLALCSGLTWALYIVLMDKYDFSGMTSEQIVYMVAIGDLLLISLIYGPISGTLAVHMPPIGWLAVVASNVFIGVLGVVFFSIGVRYTEASTAAIASTLEPVTSILVGILLMGEPCTVRMVLGMAMILAAVVITTVKD